MLDPLQPAMVPFRHSKLTELFQSFFSGDGRAVLIAAINPYSTSYEENLSVLRFAAVASRVATQQKLSKAPSSHAIAQLAVPRYQQPLQPRLQRQNSTAMTPAAKGLPVLPSLREDESGLLEEPSAEASEGTLLYDDMPTTPLLDPNFDNEASVEGTEEDEDTEDDAWEEALLDEIRHLRRVIVKQQIEQEVAIEAALQKARDETDRQFDEIERNWNARLDDEVSVGNVQ